MFRRLRSYVHPTLGHPSSGAACILESRMRYLTHLLLMYTPATDRYMKRAATRGSILLSRLASQSRVKYNPMVVKMDTIR